MSIYTHLLFLHIFVNMFIYFLSVCILLLLLFFINWTSYLNSFDSDLLYLVLSALMLFDCNAVWH